MILSPPPTDLALCYAHMGAEALGHHLAALVAALEQAGVEITTGARVGLDEIDEALLEHHARHNPPALGRALLARGDVAADTLAGEAM